MQDVAAGHESRAELNCGDQTVCESWLLGINLIQPGQEGYTARAWTACEA